MHLAHFPKAEDITGAVSDPASGQAVWKDFETLMKVRDAALKALEVARQEKTIGSALEATVTISGPSELVPLLQRYRNDLRFLLIVSGVEVKPSSGGNGNTPLHVLIEKAPGRSVIAAGIILLMSEKMSVTPRYARDAARRWRRLKKNW